MVYAYLLDLRLKFPVSLSEMFGIFKTIATLKKFWEKYILIVWIHIPQFLPVWSQEHMRRLAKKSPPYHVGECDSATGGFRTEVPRWASVF